MMGARLTRVVVVVAVALAGLLAAPVLSAPTQAPPRRGGTLTVGVLTEAVNLDAQMVAITPDVPVAWQIYDTLLRYDLDLKLRPHIAESYERVDTTTYRFKLRQGVRFHNGREVKAEDIRYSLLRARDPNLKITRRLVEHIAEVRVLDEYGVEVKLRGPDQLFPHWVASVQTGIVPREEIEKAGPGFNKRPVGTGPFRFVDWKKDSHITIEANREYFLGRPPLDRVIFRTIPDPAVMLLELENGKIDIAQEVFEDDYPRVRDNKNLVVGSTPELNYRFLGMNLDDGTRGAKRTAPYKDIRVRRAVYHAVRWDNVFRSAVPFDLFGTRQYCHAPTVTPFYYKGCKDLWPQPAYDPARSKKLLAEAGFPNGFKTSILIWQKPFEKLAIPIQADLRRVGIDPQIIFQELGTWIENVNAGNIDMYAARWAGNDMADPMGWLFVQFHSSQYGPPGNRARYHNPEVDRLLAQARDASGATRLQLFRQAQTIVIRDVVQIPVYSTHAVMAWHQKVKGFRPDPMRSWSGGVYRFWHPPYIQVYLDG